jgi:hypothetical protein
LCDNGHKHKRKRSGMTVLGWLSVLIIWSLVSVATLILSLVFTNPVAIGPVGVTLWFVILFASLASIVCLLLYTAKTFLHVHATAVGRLRYSWRQGLLIGGWLSGIIALSSLRQLGVLDGILLGILLVIVEVYVRFRWP